MSGRDETRLERLQNIPGRRIGDTCTACMSGRLQPVTIVNEGSNGIIGPAGRSWHAEYIDRLGCSSCSASFEAKDRGRALKEVRQEQRQENRD